MEALQQQVESYKPEEPAIKITVQRLINKAPSEAPPAPSKIDSFLRVELGETVLVTDANRKPLSQVQAEEELQLQVIIPCNPSHRDTLVQLAKYPLLITFLEVLPKDKKQKEEKTKVLSQAALDLLPYVQGHLPSRDTRTLILHSTEEGAGDERELVTDICISAINPSHPRIANSNVLSLRLRSLHSLPDSWNPASFPYTFTASLPLPSPPSSSATPPHRTITIPQGILKPAPSQDHTSLPTHWKWPVPIASPDTSKAAPMEPRPLEDEVGELHGKCDVDFRQNMESDHARVEWSVQYRTWMTSEDTESLLQELSLSPLWPLEVGRYTIPPPVVGKGKAKEQQEPVLSYHSLAYLDLSPLLYPGATTICGAFSLHPFSRSDMLAKTEHMLPSALAPPTSDTDDVSAGGKKNSMKTTNSSAKIGEGAGSAEEGEVKREAAAYEEAKSYLFLEVELHSPLIAKRPASVLEQRVREYIPDRPPLPPQSGGVAWAVNDFQEQAASIAGQLVSEFRTLHDSGALGSKAEVRTGVREGSAVKRDEGEERRHKFIFHLNSTGKYHAIKEQLKRSVVKVVREKYLNKVTPDDEAQFHKFLSELYVFLVDQMHAGLKKVFSIEGSAPSVASPLNPDLLKHFAFEAESAGDYVLAERYHKERVSRQGQSSELWYDYAVFCLLACLPDRCEQCLKEAVALDSTMVPALLLYGMVCCLDEKYDLAADLFELATTSDPTNVIAWTMRGLYYEHACNQRLQTMCFHEAESLIAGQHSKTYLRVNKGPSKSTLLMPGAHRLSKTSISSKVAVNLRQVSNSSLGKGPGKESTEGGGASALVSEESQKEMSPNVSATAVEPSASLGNLEVGAGDDDPVQDAHSADIMAPPTTLPLRRHSVSPVPVSNPTSPRLHDKSSVSAGVKQVRNEPLSTPHTHIDPTAFEYIANEDDCASTESELASIYLKTASYLLDVHAFKFAEMSLAHELTREKESVSNPTYLVAEARLHMQRHMYLEAKKCLKKALMADIQNSNAWALLGHTHYQMGEYAEAQDAYERTLGFVTPPAHTHLVYTRLADIYLKEEKYVKAKEILLHACKQSPSSRTWFGVGVACYQLGDLEQAEDALSEANILNNLDPDVWAYLTMVCLKTQRPVEAEQALKFAIKVGLRDKTLIGRIQELHSIHCPHADLVHLPSLHPQPSHLSM